MPDVSVIIPCYRAGRFLARFCASLRAQTYSGGWEAVFVDDGDDGCDYGPVLAEGFRLIRRKNGGAAAARNTGLDSATGGIVLFADPDDLMDPDWMSHLVESIEGVDLGWCGFRLRGGESGPTTEMAPPDPGAVYRGEDVKRRVRKAVFGYRVRDILRWWTPKRMWRGCGREFGNVWAKAFRRTVIGDLRFDETLVTYDDAMFLSAYAERAKSMRVSSASDYEYIVRPEGVMSSGLSKRKASVKFTMRDARRRLDPGMKWWRGTYLLSAVELLRDAGVAAAWRYLTFKGEKK